MAIRLRFLVIILAIGLAGCNTSRVLDVESSLAPSMMRQEIEGFVQTGSTRAESVVERFGKPTSRVNIEGGGYSLDYSSFDDGGFVVITFDADGVAIEVRSSDQL